MQKAFDAVDHQTLLSVNGHDSALAAKNCGVPQGFAVGRLLFVLDINDLSQVIKFCKIHNFADDSNPLFLCNSIKKLNKLVNADLKRLFTWLIANRISLNVKQLKWKSLNLIKRYLKGLLLKPGPGPWKT